MTDSTVNPVPKVHPATRPVEPEDPMNLHAFEVPGDTELMLRIVVEEYARMGCNLDSLMNMFRDPFYQSLHGLWQLYGEDELRRRVIEILGRCGIMRTTTIDSAPPSANCSQLSFLPNGDYLEFLTTSKVLDHVVRNAPTTAMVAFCIRSENEKKNTDEESR